jgi:hypothetical protein
MEKALESNQLEDQEAYGRKCRIYANLMRTSIFKTLKPKKYLLVNVMHIGKKCTLYNDEFLLRIQFYKKKHYSLINQRKKADAAGLDHPIHSRMSDRRSTTTLLCLMTRSLNPEQLAE